MEGNPVVVEYDHNAWNPTDYASLYGSLGIISSAVSCDTQVSERCHEHGCPAQSKPSAAKLYAFSCATVGLPTHQGFSFESQQCP